MLNSDGTVDTRKVIRYKVVMDERICDGYYYASAIKCFRKFLENPASLELPPEEVKEDIK